MNYKVARVLGDLAGDFLESPPREFQMPLEGGRWEGWVSEQREGPRKTHQEKPAVGSCGFIEGLGCPLDS